ncbi:MAG TPA: hypothetical protein VF070_45240, partial [Streptosporangiaceae bacterium]
DRFTSLAGELDGATAELRGVWCGHGGHPSRRPRPPQVGCPDYGGKLSASWWLTGRLQVMLDGF